MIGRRLTRAGFSRTTAGLAAGIALVSLQLVVIPFASIGNAAAATDGEALPEVRKYCSNIAAAATDARFAWQTAKLTELEKRVKGKLRELDTKTAELRQWIEKREALEKKAGEKLVGIYAKMRPETAATQLSNLDDQMAAAVLGQLNPRQASAIFNEIVPDRAAKLAGLIAGTPADKTP